MRRLFYLAVGVGIGIAAVRKATKAAQKFTPSGMAGSARSSASGLFDSARAFIDEVRVNMAEREIQLHEALSGDDANRERQR
jgi:hypothetical protein